MTTWVNRRGPLPPGVARCWNAVEGGLVKAAIFELQAGGEFMVCYHAAGERKATVDRLPSFTMAQQHLTTVLNSREVIGQPIDH